ncbi:hypothetical protein A3A39_02080 [Candidatus Kaiserbacteria bacterium RIFCSPLOWO2_01_FULL_54_13]|uniref:phenylalanine--tRNA ligase n=1 Tax=Candidatus Kaiserbacteria bacterium RIFCSPLOWO2_01_FULL_54_13 TaxID=1798512 RepID=A0A1F6F144_9BACT|nr:MAG: hypothetical protein A3A39_02080 [Candidatus Kaiserbacteria bacterium RIFCSPLOWO2_01_FULL_54_13]
MKISRNWLQTFFEKPLPDAQALSDALTFHAFEIESVDTSTSLSARGDAILDVKVTPNRGHDALSHRGIAKEISAILNIPMAKDLPISGDRNSRHTLEPQTDVISVSIEDSKLCPRFTGAYIRGLKVGASPEWLRVRLEAVGQKTINNIVDATNYVMFNIGQPLHAFDLGKLGKKRESYAMTIRLAKKSEKLIGLDDKEYELTSSMLVIEDANAGKIVSIAGIKGGKPTGIDETTTDMFLEAANWDGVTIRKTSQALKLRTDASERFQQVISPELAAYGTRAAADLIVEIAGGEIVGFVDEYPKPQDKREVSVSLEQINGILGTKFTKVDVADVFKRLDLPHHCDEMSSHCMFIVKVPFDRLDIVIPEDLAEEVGRIIGYDKIPAVDLSKFPKKSEINKNFYAAEHTREDLISKGYSEVFTSVFAEKGERAVANKVGGEKPYLRTTLVDGLTEALERNSRNKDLLGLEEVKVFEIGTVWKDGKEAMMIGTADLGGAREEPLRISGVTISRYDELPISPTKRYTSFSKYPFIVRDISLWVPAGTKSGEILEIVRVEAGELLVRSELFDTFEKGEKKSLAFRLVLQSFEKTLTDEEANAVMKRIYTVVKARGWEVR